MNISPSARAKRRRSKVNRLCLKDPGGLLTPERVQTLVPIMFANANGIPMELHTHCTTGLGPLCCLEAVKLGIKIVNTALPPLADGSSNPSLFNVAKNLRALGYKTLIDEEILKPVSRPFHLYRQARGFPDRRAGGIRLFAVSAPGPRRHDFQPALSAAQGRLGKQNRSGPRRNHPCARRARLPDHGHAAVAIRRQPSGHQRDRRRTLQRSDRPDHSVRARLLGQGRRRADGAGSESEDHGSPARQRMGRMATARADRRGAAQKDERGKRFR